MKRFEEATGQGVTKENFLAVYTPAHLAAFTEANIKSAFAKTGVYPIDRNAISPTALKASIESSCMGDGLPLPQSSPVKAVAGLIKAQGQLSRTTNTGEAAIQMLDNIPVDPILLTETRAAVHSLSKTSAGFLVSQSPIKLSMAVPLHIPKFPQPLPVPEKLLSLVPDNRFEEELQDTLEQYVKREIVFFSALTAMQASLILQNLYCERLRGQLNAKEKKGNTKKASGKLVGDGLPRCLTDPQFMERVAAFVQRQLAEEAEKERMRTEKDTYAIAIQEWNQTEDARKSSRVLRTAEWKVKVKEWEAERDDAKREHRRTRWTKPVLGKFPKAAVKPKAPKRVQVDQDAAPVEQDEEIDIDEGANESTSSISSTDDL